MTHYWHPFADMASVREHGELVLSSGEGAEVTDADGRTYVDATAALWYCNVGHGRRSIADAAARQMARLASYTTFGDTTVDVTGELADRLVALSPMPDASVFLTSGGSDAIDSAVKLSLRYWQEVGRPGRTTFVRRSGAYHGMHIGGTALSGIPANRLEHPGGVASVEVPHDDADALARVVEELGADAVAGFLCEPVMGAGGVHPPAPGYLAEVQRICADHDLLFIVDEVITGFGRCGRWFASERFGLSPDVICFAKGVTSGYLPLGGLVVGPRVMEPFWSRPGAAWFRHGYTYSGHAAVAAAAIANLDVLEHEDLLGAADALERQMVGVLAPLADHPLVAEVRGGVGALAAVQLTEELLAAPGAAESVVTGIRGRGVLSRLITGGALQVSPPLVVTRDQLAAVAAAITGALDDVADGRGAQRR